MRCRSTQVERRFSNETAEESLRRMCRRTRATERPADLFSDLLESGPTMSADSPAVPNVLIVEDEMILRMRAVDIVEDAGFCSVEAINADEAISILESRSDISLLFTDIQMPGSMDGLKLAHAVHDRWPAIKIILVSGHVQPSDAERPANSRFFGKPLGVEQMTTE